MKTSSILKNLKLGSLATVVLILLGACSATKFLKENESFYTGAEIKIDTQGKKIRRTDRVKSDLETFITPKPNGKFLGSRPGVWFYYIAGTPKKKKGLKSFIKNKLGQPPVLLKDATPTKTAEILEAQLNNEGYFRSTVSSEVKTKRKKSSVIYTVKLEQPYRLRNIHYLMFDTTQAMAATVKKESLVKERQRYKVQRLQAEQSRIQEVVQNMGLYFFDDRYLIFDADSTVAKRKVDLDLKTEPGMPDKATRVYYVKSVNVFPNFSFNRNDSSRRITGDTTRINGFNYIDNVHNFREDIITNVINLKPDSIYRRVNQEYTLSHLMSLKTFKFVNIKFREDRHDSSALHANIFLTPLLKKSIRMQVQGVSKSNNFVGPGFELTFTNRNIFRGAEMFQMKFNTAYEMQISRQQSGALNSFEIGVESSLSVPRFLSPFRVRYSSAKFLPRTEFKSAYNFQQRIQYFNLTSFNVGYGYVWRETTLKTHELFPVDISYVHSGNRSDAFNDLLNTNPTLKNSFQNQFIVGSHYSFTLNTQLTEDIEEKYNLKKTKRSNFYFKGTIDGAGNFLNAIHRTTTKKNEETEGPYQILGEPYSRYLKGDVDFRYYFEFDRHRKLATRFITGMGYAFGDSATLPYIKQFSSGGSNSLRAFPARSVGPGLYNVRTDTSFKEGTYFIDQRGDIKLEASIEYRFDIIKALKGGTFVDIGNIWLWKEDPKRPGSEFNRKKFINELAIGTGVGLRYDFSFFVLRFDLAWPLRKAFKDENGVARFDWVNDIDIRSSRWRKDNLILNIAIGYPF